MKFFLRTASFRTLAGNTWPRDLACVALAIVAVSFPGCGESDRVRVNLAAGPSRDGDPRRLLLQAQVSGPQEHLSYRWFTETGECVPQRTDSADTIFTFGETQAKDRIVVEVWRGNRSVARGELVVTRANQVASGGSRRPNVQVEMTDIPPYDPVGGPNTRTHIGGTLTGDLEPGLVVIIYARANDTWFVQPTPGSKHSLRSDHTFSTWTHTGSEYAALVVRLDFNPLPTTPTLQLTDKDVLGHVIVEGERR